MQRVRFGRFEELQVQNGQPIFDPPPRLIKVSRIGTADDSTPPTTDGDWLIKEAVADLFDELSALGTGTVSRLEFRRGLPCLLETAIPATAGPDRSTEWRNV
jgi:hypothetical protein